MHRLDPVTTVLTAALAIMTALALLSETPFTGARGRAGAVADVPAVPQTAPAPAWVALTAVGASALPSAWSAGR